MAQPKITGKIGWLLNRFSRKSAGRIFAAAAITTLALSAAPAGGQVIWAKGDWAALRFGQQCEARSRAINMRRGAPPAIAGFAFDAAGRRSGQLYVRLSRAPRAGSTAILAIGNQPFLLSVRGQWAWGRDSRQDAAIMAAARLAGGMRVESRGPGGRRFVDRFSLAGAATAIDAAAAACALAGKSR